MIGTQVFIKWITEGRFEGVSRINSFDRLFFKAMKLYDFN